MSLIGALTKAAKAGETAKKTAPFYSAVDEALANLARPKGTGAEFLTEVLKQPGVKKAEIADRKLEQAFKAKGKMTKEEAQQVLKDNPPPKLQEREYNEKMVREEEDIKEELAQQMYGRSYEDLSHRDRRPIFDETQRIMGEENGPQYGDYKTPGGENYREILLKLPQSRPNAANYRDSAKYDADMKAFNASGKADYQSSHWKQDPNVLAHMRVQDRTGPNGEKILHVEEIQSDWHQEGRKKGYMPSQQEIEAMNRRSVQIEAKGLDATPEEKKEWADIMNRLPNYGGGRQVPDAPFKKNWHELAMKRLLNYAADNGYDSIAITPGAEQAKRYDLSKQINTISWNKQNNGLYGIEADAVNGRPIIKKNLTEQELEDTVGKEVANRIVNGVGQFANDPLFDSGKLTRGRLENLDLQVGGEGMKGFYDQILPSYLNTFGKPYGSQVGQIGIRDPNAPSSAARYAIVRDADNNYRLQDTHTEQFALPEIYKSSAEAESAIDDKINRSLKLHNFPITPEMRQQIQQKGLPLYQQIGIPTAGAGAASQVPETEDGMAGGGIVNSLAKTEALAKLAKLREQMAPRAEAVQNLMKMDENRYLRDVVPNSLTNPEIEAEIARMKARAEASQPEVKKADGGAINYNTAPDMSDGGRIIQGAPFKRGGKVKVTTNRDAMFMELSNKKLKRK